MEATPAVLYDALVLPDATAAAVQRLATDGRTLEFLKDQYRHCKPILAMGSASTLLNKAGIPPTLPSGKLDPGLLLGASGDAGPEEAFIKALGQHRHFARETDPPSV
jgi:catalase